MAILELTSIGVVTMSLDKDQEFCPQQSQALMLFFFSRKVIALFFSSSFI